MQWVPWFGWQRGNKVECKKLVLEMEKNGAVDDDNDDDNGNNNDSDN